MNRDSDITKDILLRLLLESDSEDNSQSGDRHLAQFTEPEWPHSPTSSSGASSGNGGPASEDLSPSGLDPLAQFDQDLREYSIGADPNAVFDPGDHPVVQTHFEALLKRRLKQEITQRPPLFPWEKGLQDYPDTLSSESGAASVWLDHLRDLQVPAGLPEEILNELLMQCQRLAQQPLQIGQRLIGAVESLFPDQPQILDYIAGVVTRPAYRSAQVDALEQVDYTTASTQQQIALAMITAQGIFEALALTVSTTTPIVTRTWLTIEGPLTVTATYLDSRQLEVRVHLPQAGGVVLSSGSDEMTSERSTAGDLILLLESPQQHVPYSLTVSLGHHEAAPLRFQISVEAPETEV